MLSPLERISIISSIALLTLLVAVELAATLGKASISVFKYWYAAIVCTFCFWYTTLAFARAYALPAVTLE